MNIIDLNNYMLHIEKAYIVQRIKMLFISIDRELKNTFEITETVSKYIQKHR